MDAFKYFGELYGCKMPVDDSKNIKDMVQDVASNKGRWQSISFFFSTIFLHNLNNLIRMGMFLSSLNVWWIKGDVCIRKYETATHHKTSRAQYTILKK